MIHLDALLIFIGIGFLISLLLKTLWHRFIRFTKHIAYMKSIAGGTFVMDAEANYWLDLIKRRDYKPIWRWYFGEKWSKQHKQDKVRLLTEEQKGKIVKHKKIRKAAGITSAILAIGIVIALLIPQFVVVQEIQTKTTIFSTSNSYFVGGKLQRANRSYDVALVLLVQRTDKVLDPKPVTAKVLGAYVDVYSNMTNSTTNQSAIYGTGFGKVNATTLLVTEFTMYYNTPNNIYMYTQTLVKDGYELVYIYLAIRADLIFPDCQKLATITVTGETIESSTPFSIYENGCPSYGTGRGL